MWFESIASAADCADVDNSPLDFSSLVDSVRYGNCHHRLPPTISGNDDGKKRPNLPSPKLGHEPKKPKTGTAIVNKHPLPELKLLPGETWVSNFANKHKGCPWWDADQQVRMCAWWHIAGRCFNNCHHVKSHVSRDKIPAEKLTEFKEYLRKCCSN